MGKKVAIIVVSVLVALGVLGGGSAYAYKTISVNNSFAESEYTLCVDQSQLILPEKTMSSGLVFAVEDPSIVQVDIQGNVRGISLGSTQLYAKDGIFTYETTVVVRDHDYTEATCTEASVCTYCGAEGAPALGHDSEEAKCTEDVLCKRCGEVVYKALGHDFVPATCTEDSYCSRCNEPGEEKALGHDMQAATCTEPKTCSRCDYTEGKALGHKVSATLCTEDKVCSRCGVTVEKAKSHVMQDATCTSPSKCKNCSYTEGNALGHNYVTTETDSATVYTCSRCGDSYSKAKVSTASLSEYAARVIELVNEERAKEGLSALAYDASLGSAAQVRATEIETLFSHTRPDGTRCFTAMDQAGCSYNCAGENIAAGQRSPEEVVTAWMNSEGHRANIMNASFGRIGVGFVYDANGTYKYYWSQFFAN